MKNSTAFVNKNNKYIQNKIKRNKYKSIIINVDTKSKRKTNMNILMNMFHQVKYRKFVICTRNC